MNSKRKSPGFGLLALSQFGLVGIALFLLQLFKIQLPESDIGFMPAIIIGTILAVTTLAVFWCVYLFGGRFSCTLLDDIRRVSGLFNNCSWVHCAAIAVLAGVGEELLFRGFLQVWLDAHVSIVAAILIASVIFGLLHYLSHAYFICATLMSIAFGVGYWLTDSMLMVMVWHGVYDFMALLIIVKFPHVIGIHPSQKSDA